MKKIKIDNDHIALVDDEDYRIVSNFHWFMNGGYPKRTISKSKTLESMHHLIMGYSLKIGVVIDHINGNKLDNRKCNLRFATIQQNSWNLSPDTDRCHGASIYKGVQWRKDRHKWIARIGKDGRRYCLGSFNSEEEAALAYNKAALKMFGEFARLNKIDDKKEKI